MSTPDLAEPIIAYRAWDIRNGKLEAIAGNEVWVPRQAVAATCRGDRPGSNPFATMSIGNPIYHIGMTLPLQPGTTIAVAGRTYVVTNIASGTTTNQWTISSAPIPGANVMVRADPPGPHAVCPDPNCWCGYYAHKDERDVEVGLVVGQGRAWGTVALWGRVIEHETGYRAQYAYPVSLHTRHPRVAHQLARAYGVQVIASEGGEMGDPYSQLYPGADLGRSRARRLEAWALNAPMWQVLLAMLVVATALTSLIFAAITAIMALV